MFLLEGKLIWTASDLTAAADCEYALLRTVDYRLEWVAKPDFPDDPLLQQIARLGDRHERRLLAERQAAGSVIELPRVATYFCKGRLSSTRPDFSTESFTVTRTSSSCRVPAGSSAMPSLRGLPSRRRCCSSVRTWSNSDACSCR
jgi:hypothetical protein